MARAPITADIEVIPEADRLEGFPHPRETRTLFGHAKAEQVLSAAFASGKMHHAWLVTGAEGIGKATLCYKAAKALLAAPDERGMFAAGLDIEPGSATARQIVTGVHPGLIVIRRPYDTKAKRFSITIPVDEVRRLRSFLSLTAGDQGWRAVIVDSADELNIYAANALLKSLEEPPPQTVFLIVSSAPGRLLPTIRSRCRTLALEPLPAADLRKAAEAALEAAQKPALKEDDFANLEVLAKGSPRRLLALLERGGLGLQARIDKIFARLPALDVAAAHTLADELQPAAQEQKFELFYDLFLDQLLRIVRAGATGEGRSADVATARRLMGGRNLATYAQLWETLVRDKADAAALNLDRKSLILDTLSRLEAAARG
ncbi:MAG TPA: DNA polymerase III subunit delta' [Hyphomicrobium sp.]|nr:DNA polymerase III subunit delta' [Hyphomicrobium sp.]